MAHYGALYEGVLRALYLAKHVVPNSAVDYRTADLIEVGFDPLRVGAVDGFRHLGDVDVDEVRADAHHRAVLFVELLHVRAVVGAPGLVEPPEVSPS